MFSQNHRKRAWRQMVIGTGCTRTWHFCTKSCARTKTKPHNQKNGISFEMQFALPSSNDVDDSSQFQRFHRLFCRLFLCQSLPQTLLKCDLSHALISLNRKMLSGERVLALTLFTLLFWSRANYVITKDTKWMHECRRRHMRPHLQSISERASPFNEIQLNFATSEKKICFFRSWIAPDGCFQRHEKINSFSTEKREIIWAREVSFRRWVFAVMRTFLVEKKTFSSLLGLVIVLSPTKAMQFDCSETILNGTAFCVCTWESTSRRQQIKNRLTSLHMRLK